MINSPYSKSYKSVLIPEEKPKKRITLNKIFKSLNKNKIKKKK